MKNQINDVKETLDRLHDMQRNHILSFGKEVLPDLEKQSKDRSIEMARLIKRVNLFLKTALDQDHTDTESILIDLNARVNNLLGQNRELETKVRAFKENLQANMKKISKGKKAIGSYRSQASASNNPRVLSITN